MKKTVKCKSGLTGWRKLLRDNYSSYEEFNDLSFLYKLHERLGYPTAQAAWDANPIIEGSVDPSDLQISRPSWGDKSKAICQFEKDSLALYQEGARTYRSSDNKFNTKKLEKLVANISLCLKILKQ